VLGVRGKDRRRKSLNWLGRTGNMMYRHRECHTTENRNAALWVNSKETRAAQNCVECWRPVPAGWPVGV
jgi:hypothetical protein